MATTTPNYGWAVPTSTDLVKNGATAIETLGDAIDASLVDLRGGTTGQVLKKASATQMDFEWGAATSGLNLISTTTFTSVASQSFSNVFSDTYNIYRIIMRLNTSAGAQAMNFRIRENTTDKTTGYYGSTFRSNYAGTSGVLATANNAGTTALCNFSNTAPNAFIVMDLMRETGGATIFYSGLAYNTNDAEIGFFGYQGTGLTNGTGFTIYPTANNILGTVSIYAYGQ
jgi:hypothetical protein